MIYTNFLEFYIESVDTTEDDIDNFQLEAMIKQEINKELMKKFKKATILDEKDDNSDDIDDDENKSDNEMSKDDEKKAKDKLNIVEGKFDSCVKKFNNIREGKAEFSRKYPRLSRIIRYVITIAVVLITWKIGGWLIFKKLGVGLLGKILAFILTAIHYVVTAVVAVIANKEINKKQVKDVVGFFNVNAEYLDKKIESCDDEESKQKLKNIRYDLERNAKKIQGKYYATYKIKLDSEENEN